MCTVEYAQWLSIVFSLCKYKLCKCAGGQSHCGRVQGPFYGFYLVPKVIWLHILKLYGCIFVMAHIPFATLHAVADLQKTCCVYSKSNIFTFYIQLVSYACRRWRSFYLPLSGFMQRRTYSCVRNLMSLLAMALLHTPCIFQYINIWHFYLKLTWAASVYLYRVASESHQAYLYYSYIVLYYLCI